MRRVQSSVHGVCVGAGPTIVLQAASPVFASLGRRSSLVFTAYPPDTPTRGNSLKLQRAASSFSATGWDFSAVGEDDVGLGFQADFTSYHTKSVQEHCSRRCNEDVENWGCEEAEGEGASENISCFVAVTSPACASTRSSAGPAIRSPPRLLQASKSCAAELHLPLVNRCEDNTCSSSPAGDWLGAALSSSAAPVPPASPCGGRGAAPSSSRWQVHEEGLPALVEPENAADMVGTPHYSGLRRVRRVVCDMDLMAWTV